MNKFGVLIGRFQPCHNGHLSTIVQALTRVDKLIIVLGSANACRTIKNPWSAAQREQMIYWALTHEQTKRVKFVHVPDYMYNDNAWIISLQEKVSAITEDERDVLLFGHEKDDSGYYLKLFPQWQHCQTKMLPALDATKIRSMYFDCNLSDLYKYVPEPVFLALKSFMMKDATTRTEEFASLQAEYQHVEKYKDEWKVRITPEGPGVPYPVTFMTVDAVVIRSGHVLVVRRGGYPGKGLIALPGGFVNQRERIQQACLRELREETRIVIPQQELEAAIVGSRVFDHPDRSLRGRTITHAYCLDLGAGPLPKVKGDDDADKAWWMPLREVMASEERFFEDHFHIISHFVNKF